MRLVLLLMTSALVAGCSQTLDSESSTARTALSAPSPSATTGASPTPGATSRAAEPTGTMAPGAEIGAVISRIEDGEPAEPTQFGTVTRDGVATPVDGGVAFTTDTVSCISSPRYRDGILACLVDLADPPPRPPDVFTVWKGNWVDFDGSSVEIGSQHGDPGPFGDGEGAALPDGSSVAFGDFRCRADTDAVLCVNYAQRAAVQLSAAGVEGFGCLSESQAPPGIGVRLSC